MSVERMQPALELARLPRAGEHAAVVANAGLSAELHPDDARDLEEIASARHPATKVTIDLVRARENRIVLPEDAGPASQAYRMLRTQILQRVRAHAVRTLGVVSAVDGEGKTLTAINLALGIAAESNQNLLLVDLDLRRPSLASLLGMPVEQGLEAWFSGVTSIGDLCYGLEGIDRLEIVPTLAPVRGSSELLAGRRAQDMLLDLKNAQRHGLVLLDLPPVLLTDDFLTVAPLIDAVVLVATEGVTKRDDITRVREMLGPVRLLGTVLNRASESEKRAY